mgnify:CR=1 FL=1
MIRNRIAVCLAIFALFPCFAGILQIEDPYTSITTVSNCNGGQDVLLAVTYASVHVVLVSDDGRELILSAPLSQSSQSIGIAAMPAQTPGPMRLLVVETDSASLVDVHGDGAITVVSQLDVPGLGWPLTPERAIIQLPFLGPANDLVVIPIPGPHGVTPIIVNTSGLTGNAIRTSDRLSCFSGETHWWRVQPPGYAVSPFFRATHPMEIHFGRAADVYLLEHVETGKETCARFVRVSYLAPQSESFMRMECVSLNLADGALVESARETYALPIPMQDQLLDLDKDGHFELLRMYRPSDHRKILRIECQEKSPEDSDWQESYLVGAVNGLPLLLPNGQPMVLAIGDGKLPAIPTVCPEGTGSSVRNRVRAVLSEKFNLHVTIWAIHRNNKGLFVLREAFKTLVESNRNMSLRQFVIESTGDFTGDGRPDLLIASTMETYTVYPHITGAVSYTHLTLPTKRIV